MRAAEAALFLLPLVLFLVLRFAAHRLTNRAVAALLAGLALGGLVLVWFGLRAGGPPGAPYQPAHLDNGQIAPGRIGP